MLTRLGRESMPHLWFCPAVNQTIAIVGASTRAAAASAKRAGFTPITADLFADADLRAIATTTRISPYPEGFLDWLRTIEPPAWMYTGALENHPDLVDQMAWIAPLWGNPGDVLQHVRSPWKLQNILRNAGLLFPETRDSADGLPLDGSWLAKTYHGASGSGVRVMDETWRGDKETRRQSEVSFSEKSPFLCYQRRIAGLPASAVFVAANRTAGLLGVTRQLVGEDWLGAHGFQYAGSIGPVALNEATRTAIKRIGNTLAERFEVVGLFGVDIVIDVAGVWALEVNPRYTASVEIVERLMGVNAIESHANAFIGNVTSSTRAGASSPPSMTTVLAGGEDAPARSVTRAHGKAILFAKRDIGLSNEFAEISLAEALRTPWPTLADVSPAGTMIEAGRPVLTFFAEGNNVDEVEQRLRQRAVDLERQIYGGGIS
jgi:predicted ATP-grasp superfamily ATP-dependent carboligase